MTTKSKPAKTYKRELASLLLVFWGTWRCMGGVSMVPRSPLDRHPKTW
jgi:hypothetical protein